MKTNIITKEPFCKKMGIACLLYKCDDDTHPVLLKITNSFKRFFPKKVSEIEHFMFFTDFGKLDNLSFEDFYDSLLQ